MCSTLRALAPRMEPTELRASAPSSSSWSGRESSSSATLRSCSGVRHLEPAAPLEHLDRVLEVLHVRPEQHRLPLRRRLEHVLPAAGHEAAAHEDERREPVRDGELADGVEHGDLGVARGRRRRCAAAPARPALGRERQRSGRPARRSAAR